MKFKRNEVLDAVQYYHGISHPKVKEYVYVDEDNVTHVSATLLQTSHEDGHIHVDSGDWIVTGDLGETYILTDYQFKHGFVPVDSVTKQNDFDKYQKEALSLAVYPDLGRNIIYPTLGLVGESGEVAEKVKKLLRDSNGVVSDEFKQAIKKELGDVMWYLSALAFELGFELSDISNTNLSKLKSRKERGTLQGSGDNR